MLHMIHHIYAHTVAYNNDLGTNSHIDSALKQIMESHLFVSLQETISSSISSLKDHH